MRFNPAIHKPSDQASLHLFVPCCTLQTISKLLAPLDIKSRSGVYVSRAHQIILHGLCFSHSCSLFFVENQYLTWNMSQNQDLFQMPSKKWAFLKEAPGPTVSNLCRKCRLLATFRHHSCFLENQRAARTRKTSRKLFSVTKIQQSKNVRKTCETM